MSEIREFKRRTTPKQRARQQEIIRQTTSLLGIHGAGVSMEMVGESAQVSRSTLYRYYASREHLIAEVTLEAGNSLIRYLEVNPPDGATLGARISHLCNKITLMAESNPNLLAACITNLSSNDPAVVDTFNEIEQLIPRFFQTVLGEQAPVDSHHVQETVFRYLLGSFMLATTGKLRFSQLADGLTDLCKDLMEDVWDIRCS